MLRIPGRLVLAGVALGLTLAGAIGASSARAQDLNHQRLPIGDRPVGMGGAYTGLAEDVSALWYNPAGLAFLDGATFSGALSINIYDEYRVEGGFAYGDEAASLDDRGSVTIPLFVGGMAKVGTEPRPVDRRHALAGALVNPSVFRRRFDVTLPAGASGYSASLRIENYPEQQYYGLGYAYRVGPDLAIGLGAFLDYGKLRHQEDESLVAQGVRRPDGLYDGSSLTTRRSTAETTEYAFLFRFGVLYQPMDELRLGLMIQPPDLPIHRTAYIDEAIARVDVPTATGTFAGNRQNYLDGRLPAPFEARLGAAYRFRDSFRLSLDVSVYGPIGDTYIFGEPVPDPVSGLTPTPGRYYENPLHGRPTANVAVGTETLIAGVIPLAIGFYTDFSAASKHEGLSPTYRTPHIHNYGFTLVTGYRAGRVNFSVGATFTVGFGQADGPDPMNVGMFRSLPATQSSMYLFLTGYANAAEELASTVERAMASEEERARRQEEREERERLERLREECERRLREELERGEDDDGDDAGEGPAAPEPSAPVAPPVPIRIDGAPGHGQPMP